MNRARLNDYLYYEVDEEGVNIWGDAPVYKWDNDANRWDNDHSLNLLVGGKPSSKVHAQTCYIPTKIYGTDEFQRRIIALCEKYQSRFKVVLKPQAATLPAMG